MKYDDDPELTLFLIEAMTLAFHGRVKPVPKSTIPGTHQRWFKKEDSPYLYLETIAGTRQRSQSHILVMRRDSRRVIFGMHIVSELMVEALREHSVLFTDVQRLVTTARLQGFEQARANIKEGRSFSLFNVPRYEEHAPVEKGGLPGMLTYTEDIDDNLEHFGGGETVTFRGQAFGARTSDLFRSMVQGGRL